MLICSRCKRELPRESFTNSQLKKAKERSCCKDCTASPKNKDTPVSGNPTINHCGLLGAIVQCLPAADVAMPDADVERLTAASLAIMETFTPGILDA